MFKLSPLASAAALCVVSAQAAAQTTPSPGPSLTASASVAAASPSAATSGANAAAPPSAVSAAPSAAVSAAPSAANAAAQPAPQPATQPAIQPAIQPAAQTPPHADAQAAPPASAQVEQLRPVEVKSTRQRLDAARNLLSPETGSSVYRFSTDDVAKLPLGDATPLNQVLLRAPGVVQDSFAAGQLHVRGDHANLQYRVDGVVIPESVSGFAGVLDTRFAESISLLTGALPAQYGYRTAGIVDIRSRDRTQDNGGSVDLLIGTRGDREVSANVGGSSGRFAYFVTGSDVRSDIGIENPTPQKNATHDATRQDKAFAHLSYLLGDDSRITLMLGSANSRFEIPNNPGQSPAYVIDIGTPPASGNVDQRQSERTNFQVLSYQSKIGDDTDYQVSLFRRSSDVHYLPDPLGDLAYTGVAANVLRRNDAGGVQLDASHRLNARHTLRFGLFYQHERGAANTSSTVFPADADGRQTSGTPLPPIVDDATLGGHLAGVYLQDEWQPAKPLTVNYGLRYDQVATVVSESQLSPRLGMVYQLGADTRLHAGYARYFTPPPTERIDTTTVAKFVGTTNALPSGADTSVRSERSHYLDAGVSQQIGTAWVLGVDAYYRRVRHLQDEGQFGSAQIFSAFNFDEGKIYGTEFSATYKQGGVTAYANYAVSAARGRTVETGQFNFAQDELDYIASHWVHLDHEETRTASTGASYRIGAGDAPPVTVSADLLYGSGLRNGFANTGHLASHTTVNGAVERQVDLGGGIGAFDLRLAVVNLFDRVYQLRDGSGIGVGAPQFGLRRSVYVGISKPFSV